LGGSVGGIDDAGVARVFEVVENLARVHAAILFDRRLPPAAVHPEPFPQADGLPWINSSR